MAGREVKLDCDGNLKLKGNIKARKIKVQQVETELVNFKPSSNCCQTPNVLYVNKCDQLVFANTSIKLRQNPKPTILRNAISQIDAGSTGIADTIMAVGPEVIVAMVNAGIAIFEKSTMERIFAQPLINFMNFQVGDVQVIYDELSQRFIATGWEHDYINAEVIIDSPPAAVGTYRANAGTQAVSQDFSVTATIEATVPASANSTVTNDLTGKIGLIATDGFTTVPGGKNSTVKGNNTAAAHAVGALFYQTLPRDSIRITGSSLIPSLCVEYESGQIISKNLPAHGTIRTIPVERWKVKNVIYFAVSKISNPRTAADWYQYKYLVTSTDDLQDFPKIAADANTLYYATQNFAPNLVDFTGAGVMTFDKAKLLDGTGPVLTGTHNLGGNAFAWPSQTIYPKTDPLQPQYFVTYDEVDSPDFSSFTFNNLIVYTAPGYKKYTVPLPQTIFVNYALGMTQPNPKTPGLEIALAGSSVVSDNSLWYSTTRTLNGVNVLRWFELDVSQVVNGGNIALKQYGDVIPANNGNTSYGTIAVNEDGDMVIGFTVSGPQQAPSPAYAWRKKSDPLGTIRPIVVLLEGLYSYNASTVDLGYAILNRWGDYNFLTYRDGRFWLYNLYPLQLSNFVTNNVSTRWSSAIIAFNPDSPCNEASVNSGCGLTNNKLENEQVSLFTLSGVNPKIKSFHPDEFQ